MQPLARNFIYVRGSNITIAATTLADVAAAATVADASATTTITRAQNYFPPLVNWSVVENNLCPFPV